MPHATDNFKVEKSAEFTKVVCSICKLRAQNFQFFGTEFWQFWLNCAQARNQVTEEQWLTRDDGVGNNSVVGVVAVDGRQLCHWCAWHGHGVHTTLVLWCHELRPVIILIHDVDYHSDIAASWQRSSTVAHHHGEFMTRHCLAVQSF